MLARQRPGGRPAPTCLYKSLCSGLRLVSAWFLWWKEMLVRTDRGRVSRGWTRLILKRSILQHRTVFNNHSTSAKGLWILQYSPSSTRECCVPVTDTAGLRRWLHPHKRPPSSRPAPPCDGTPAINLAKLTTKWLSQAICIGINQEPLQQKQSEPRSGATKFISLYSI